jgi:hypothetical protein
MEDNRKLSKRQYLTVVCGQRGEPTRSIDGDPIYTERQYFRMMHMHRKGSNRPVGWFHRGYGSDQDVEVRWLYTGKNGYFAPEISFRASKNGIKVATRVANALRKIEHTSREDPEALIEDLAAYIVEYVDDRANGCWDDYRCLRAPTDNEMMVIARAAQG